MVFVVLGCLLTTLCAATAEQANTLSCLRATQAPAIDGLLEEPCWSNTATATGFSVLGTGGYLAAPRRTTARFTYDDENLYIGVVCLDVAEQDVPANATQRDGPVFDDDCVELFISDGSNPLIYYHFAINALGSVYDGRLLDGGWNSSAVVATQRLADRWILEVAIPHAQVGGQTPRSGDVSRFNVARCHRLVGESPAYSSWSALTANSFHTPQDFASLRYTTEPIDPALLDVTNIPNPVVADFAPTETHPRSRWELAPGTEHQPEVYLSDIYTIRNHTDEWIARQSANLFPVGGVEFKTMLEAKGTDGAHIGMRVRYETTDGQVRQWPLFRDQPLTAEFVIHEKTVVLPEDACRLLAVELFRSNRRGEVVCRRAGLTLLTDTFTGIKEAGEVMAAHRLPASEPAPAIDPVRWVPSLPDGPLRVLCIIDSPLQRGIEELAQRFDMEYDLAWLQGGSYYAYGADAINQRLSRQHDPYDAILVSATIHDPALIKTIENNVHAGTGLVFVSGPDLARHDPAMLAMLPLAEPLPEMNDTSIAAGIPWRHFPTVPDNYIVGDNPDEPAIKRIGFGERAVHLIYGGPAGTYNGLIPYTGLNETRLEHWWEYAYSLLAKSLLHVAGQSQSTRIERVRVSLPQGQVVVSLAGDVASSASLKLVWANQPMPEHPPTQTQRIAPSPQTTTFEFAIPDAVLRREGLHVANLFLENDRGQMLDWTSAAFETHSVTRLSKHRPLPLVVKRNAPSIPAAIRIENDGLSSCSLELAARLIDGHGRLVWETSQAIAVGAESITETRVEIDLDRAITVWHALDVTLSESGVIVDQHRWEVHVPGDGKAFTEDFHPGLYGDFYRRTHTDEVFMEWVRKMGFDFVVEGGVFEKAPRLNVPWFDSNIAPAAYHHREGGGDRSTRNPCLSDPDHLATVLDQALAAADHSLNHGAVLLSMADEPELVKDGRIELCFGAHCTARFQAWAADHYQNLDALNDQWGTAYTTWQQVEPITADDARARGNYAQWVDFRTFMEDVYVGAYKQIRDAIHEKHPEAMVSLGNPFRLNPFSGVDHYKLAMAEDFYGKYMRPDVIKEYRSFGPDKPMQTHWGYQENLPYTHWYPWYFALHGGDAMNYYDTISSRGKYDLFDGTFRHTARSLAVSQTHAQLTTGIGKILSDTPPRPNQVAILYSQNSMKVAWIQSDAKIGREVWDRRIMEKLPVSDPFALHTKSIAQFKSMVKEAWLQPDMIAPSQILEGRLAEYRVLILPCTMALSDGVLDAIEAFVANGGTVVADLRLALFNEHGKPAPERDSVRRIFGIDRVSDACLAQEDLLSFRHQTSENILATSVRVHSLARENIVATTARVMGLYKSGTPAITIHSLGDGYAIYLNLFTESGEERQAIMNQILHWAGVTKPVALSSQNSRPVGYECFEYVQGDAHYLAVLRDMPPQEGQTIEWFDADFRRARVAKELVRIESPQPRHVYNIRSGEYIGFVNAFDVEFDQGEANVFAMFPSRIESLRIENTRPEYTQGDHVSYTVNLLATSGRIDSVIRIEVYGPDQELVEHYTKNVFAKNGRFDGSIPLALDERPGVWKLQVIDVVSKMSEALPFAIIEELANDP